MPLSIKKLLLRATNKISAQDAGNPNLQPPQEQSAFKHWHNRASRNRASACCEAHTKPTGAAHAWSGCPQCSGPPGVCSLLTSSHGAAPRGSCPTPALMGLGGSSSVLLLSRARTAELCSSLQILLCCLLVTARSQQTAGSQKMQIQTQSKRGGEP